MSNAQYSSHDAFLPGSGIWAGMRFAEKGFRLDALRTNDVLRKDEWVEFDELLVQEGAIRLRAVASLIGTPGLVRAIPNALGKTDFQYEKITDMKAAELSMDGVARTMNDRQEYSLAHVPVPICHKDFFIRRRTLESSRSRGESLDTTQVRTAGRLVFEKLEDVLINGGGVVIGGNPLYGYTTHPDRNTAGFGTGGDWGQAAKTGAQIVTDVNTMKAALIADRHYGPYEIYIPTDAESKQGEDYATGYPKTIRNRILEIEGIRDIKVVDSLASGSVVMVSLTPDSVQWGMGSDPQTVQWDIQGGMVLNFKVMAIQMPIIKSDAQNRSGVFHMS